MCNPSVKVMIYGNMSLRLGKCVYIYIYIDSTRRVYYMVVILYCTRGATDCISIININR